MRDGQSCALSAGNHRRVTGSESPRARCSGEASEGSRAPVGGLSLLYEPCCAFLMPWVSAPTCSGLAADPELRLAPADALPLSCWRSARLAASAASNSPPGSLWLSFSASPCTHLGLRPVPSTSAGLSPCLCARRGSPATFSWLVQPWGAPGPCSEGPVGCFVSALSPRCSLPPLCRCCGQHGGEAETGRGHPEEAAGSSFGKDQQPQPFCHAVQVKEGCPLCCLTHPEQDSCSGPSKHFWWWV